jgi:NAD(P)-dependent dehydrogenase (short-subunit alcohol dehydrogenase family)
MNGRLKGKAAVVTGGGRGIGRAIALALAEEGAAVVIADPGVNKDGRGFDSTPTDEVVARIKQTRGMAIANYESVVDFKAAQGIMQSCVDNFGRLDILVNCAGIYPQENFIWNLPEDIWDATIKINLYGTFNCIHWAAGLMKEQKAGRIINFTSLAFLGDIGLSAYATSKGGILSLSWTTAVELGPYNITCNIISPGAATRLTSGDEEAKSVWRKKLGAGLMTREFYEKMMNLGGPEHISPIVVYLCTDEAMNINGQIFQVEKGTIGVFSKPVEVRKIFNNGEVWPVDQLIDLIPRTLLVDYVNPAPNSPLR